MSRDTETEIEGQRLKLGYPRSRGQSSVDIEVKDHQLITKERGQREDQI